MQKKFRPSCAFINEFNNTENNATNFSRDSSPDTDDITSNNQFESNINPYLDEITRIHLSKSVDASLLQKKYYIFIFSIELHSYLPISRKTLSSTFRKKKRVFKGQCQIYENFIRDTQFSNRFELYEV